MVMTRAAVATPGPIGVAEAASAVPMVVFDVHGARRNADQPGPNERLFHVFDLPNPCDAVNLFLTQVLALIVLGRAVQARVDPGGASPSDTRHSARRETRKRRSGAGPERAATLEEFRER